MIDLLRPDIRADSLLHLPLDELREKGVTSLIIDLDNTVTEWNGREVSMESVEWFMGLKEKGFQACLVSNNRGERVEIIAEALGIPYISRAAKPRRGAFKQALNKLHSEVNHSAVVGDQLFTDVLGGNRMGMVTVLVDPISEIEFVGTRFVRMVERVFKRFLRL